MEKALRDRLAGGKFENVAHTDAKRMSAVRGRGNKTTELMFRMMLVRNGTRGWTMHPKGVPGKPDFYFPSEKIAVFTDGCFWHGCPRCGHVPKVNNSFWAAKIKRNRERDAEKVAELESVGVRSLRLWEHELRENPIGCMCGLIALLKFRGHHT
ncbi:MAG: very short patch repair endonuclease [Isosphaeraceae bacterium]